MMDDRAEFTPSLGEAGHIVSGIYEYRCVAAPAVVTVRRAKERMKSIQTLEETLNRESLEGWEYVGIDEIAIVEPRGFFSSKKTRTSFKVIVFRRLR
jgi:hypothetical protein